MEIAANKGHWLTQKELKDGDQRGFWKRMYLAHTLTPEDFEEWTDEMKASWEEEHKETEEDI